MQGGRRGRGRGRGQRDDFGGGRGGGGQGQQSNFMGGGPMHMDQMNPSQPMNFPGPAGQLGNAPGMPPVMPFGMQGRPMPPMQPPGPPPLGPPGGMQPSGPPMQRPDGSMSMPPVPMHPGQMHGGPPGPPGGMMMQGGPQNMPPPPMPPIMGMQQQPGPPPPHAQGPPQSIMPFPPPHLQQQHHQQQQQQQQQQQGMMGQGMGQGGGGGGRGQNVSSAALAQAARGGTGYKAPGSQSAAPGAKEVKNDYCQQFVDTGARPQNYLRDSHLTDRYEEYPKMKELIRMKDQMVADHTTPAYFLNADLRTLKLSPETFGTKFDVILVDPPWEEYIRRAPHAPGLRDREYWAWQDIQALEIENIADTPSFIFLWCGTAEGLDAGRHCLNKWGFRRVEDIVWIKSNKDRNPRTGYLQPINQEPYSVLTHTKEHCLMGIKGSVRRNMDGHLIHANCDTDVIVSEEPPAGSMEKPTEMYEIIERFCLAKRRIELFGEEHNIRNGWVTVGRNLPPSNFRPEVYSQNFKMPDGRPYVENTMGGRVPRGAPILIPTPAEVEEARPKSPPNMQRGRH